MNLKTVISASKWQPLVICSESNEETQIDCGGPITIEKDRDRHFLHVLIVSLGNLK